MGIQKESSPPKIITKEGWVKLLGDQFWRLNNLYWVITEKGERVKFKLNWAQYILFKSFWYLNIILKGRQIGITTYVCILFLDVCLWNSNTSAAIIAHNREEAERFFKEKIKYAYDNLAPFILRSIKADTSSTRELRFNNNSSIRVTTSARSGTYQYLHISEFGKICKKYPDKAEEIVTGSFNAVHAGQFIYVESTAEGRQGFFYEYCKKAKALSDKKETLTELDFKYFFFEWWREPKYRLNGKVLITEEFKHYFQELKDKHDINLDAQQKAWYVKKYAQQGELMKRENPSTYEEAFLAAIQGAYYATEMANCRKAGRITTVDFDPEIDVATFWDLGMDDSMSIWFAQFHRDEIRLIDYYENSDEGLAYYAGILWDKAQDLGYRYNRHVAPHDIKVREMGAGFGTGISRLESARNLKITRGDEEIEVGIRFEVAKRVERKEDGIEAVRRILSKCWFDEAKTSRGIDGLDNFQKKWDDKLGKYQNHPLDNWATHPADALQTLAISHDKASDISDDLKRQFG